MEEPPATPRARRPPRRPVPAVGGRVRGDRLRRDPVAPVATRRGSTHRCATWPRSCARSTTSDGSRRRGDRTATRTSGVDRPVARVFRGVLGRARGARAGGALRRPVAASLGGRAGAARVRLRRAVPAALALRPRPGDGGDVPSGGGCERGGVPARPRGEARGAPSARRRAQRGRSVGRAGATGGASCYGMGSSRYAAGVCARRLRAPGSTRWRTTPPRGRGGTAIPEPSRSASRRAAGRPRRSKRSAAYAGGRPRRLTNREDAPLAALADLVVAFAAGEEAGGVACRTFQHTLALLLALEAHIAGAPPAVTGVRPRRRGHRGPARAPRRLAPSGGRAPRARVQSRSRSRRRSGSPRRSRAR